MQDFNSINKLYSYRIIEKNCGYSGELIDKNGKVVSFVGMLQNDIGMSLDYSTTLAITQKVFDEFINI